MSTAAPSTVTVVISRGQSRNPEKRGLEQTIASAVGDLDGFNVLTVPHLYDLPKTSETFARLKECDGDLIVVSWIYSRAAHWVLDRNGVSGQTGQVNLGDSPSSGDEDDLETPNRSPDDTPVVDRVTDLYPRPNRKIYCLDLKIASDAQTFIDEIQRIFHSSDSSSIDLPIVSGELVEVEEKTSRRWYPVIDFDRCTNCMECIDFCLFGVYGVDHGENILVEQPDNCRKGCPACSRVCPENAIIFPQHKAPAIAGAQTDGEEGFKIDLSQLFGAPATDGDPIATAARERDEQLLLAGRDAVGIDDQLSRRQSEIQNQPKDNLDRLIDSLDAFDL